MVPPADGTTLPSLRGYDIMSFHPGMVLPRRPPPTVEDNGIRQVFPKMVPHRRHGVPGDGTLSFPITQNSRQRMMTSNILNRQPPKRLDRRAIMV